MADDLENDPISSARSKKRLPPGQRLVEKWPILDLGLHPDIDLTSWKLEVDGLVENPVTLSWGMFQDLPQSEMVSDIHCVTSWSLYDNRWTGVATDDLLSLVHPSAEARFVLFRSHDGYTTNVPYERFAMANSLLAHGWAGRPLTRDHGGPVRAIIPDLYLWKSAKWLRRISFVADADPGYWEVRGYHNDADPWKGERFA